MVRREVYLSSADWMPRNLDRRVEILFPVENEHLKQEVIHVLEIQLRDTLKAQIKQSDGTYSKVDRRGKEALCAQDYFMEYAKSWQNQKKRLRITESSFRRNHCRTEEQEWKRRHYFLDMDGTTLNDQVEIPKRKSGGNESSSESRT